MFERVSQKSGSRTNGLEPMRDVVMGIRVCKGSWGGNKQLLSFEQIALFSVILAASMIRTREERETELEGRSLREKKKKTTKRRSGRTVCP